MKESTFEHKFRVGQEIKYPDDSQLKNGKVDEVRFHKKEIGGVGEVYYLIVPERKSKRQGIVRPQEDIIAR